MQGMVPDPPCHLIDAPNGGDACYHSPNEAKTACESFDDCILVSEHSDHYNCYYRP